MRKEQIITATNNNQMEEKGMKKNYFTLRKSLFRHCPEQLWG